MPDDAPALASRSKAYDPSDIEAKWYEYWEENGFFEADADSDADSHVIMMPPPNVTGRLHIGHALQDSIQDAITRIRRMQGDDTLWMPGIDHAGIATQNKVEDKLREQEGKTRHDLGREQFVERVWDWKEEYGDIILDQKRRLGDSCDWSRQRFTMDEGFTRAVQEVFVRLYEEGLIYRGDYLVNWDPENETALSDEEVENEERDGHLWSIKYPLVDAEDRYLTIATTRPETMLGDTAIAVHPDDDRYDDLVGKTVRLPLLNREIPIIADERIDSDFGTGALKVTPAHDETDFEIGEDHDLETITIMSPTGNINENGGPYEGMDRFDARDQIVEDLEAEGLLGNVEDYVVNVPISERSEAVIEPLISRQWFVEMEPLAEPAIEAVREGEIEFFPDRWANEYFRWMENIRDWCISRQLWWGHRIPVWYHTDENGEADPEQGYVVSVEQPEEGMVQETDVLDTWFSSWLWPFATLGWPEETDDLEKFYPTDVLVSGYDILFFWIARMIMAGYQFTGDPPFTNVFITGMVKDEQGRWMSKSLGNGIDPLEMVDQYGADATRFTLTLLCAQGQDIKLAPSKFEMGRNFANKIWNAFNVFGQFMETDGEAPARDYQRSRSFDELELVEQWMLHRLNTAIEDIEDSLDRYRLNEIAERVYDVFWRDYCDWYLELIKPPYGEEMEEDKIALAAEIYETLLKLLHPLMPFITEELWWKVRPRAEGEACIAADWPEGDTDLMDEEAADTFELIQEMISGVRGIKSDYGVGLGQEIEATVSVPDGDEALAGTVRQYAGYFDKLASVTDLTVQPGAEKPKASASVVVGRCEVFVPLAGMIDLDQERERLRKEIEEKEEFLESVEQKLNNHQFVNKAPDEVVDRERQKRRDATDELERLHENLADLEEV